jgi:anaerobic magnesium-protoporphyrin IX monomethyl ester cyclase
VKELPPEVQELDNEILAFIRQGVDHEDADQFNRLALQVFDLQYRHIPLYQRYCERRGTTPGEVSSWDQIPALATDCFKAADLCLLPEHTVRTFMTSGTTRAEERGRVHFDEGGLRLMDATIQKAAAAFLFPDGLKNTVLIIAPSPEDAPHMIMAYGMNRLKDAYGLPSSRFLVGKDGFEVQDLVDALQSAEAEGIPTAVFGGSFGFVNFFDYCRRQGLRFRLPPGSRCLDAGGFKGRSREVCREEFLDACEEFTDTPRRYCVNLLGMTEVASQFYDNTLSLLSQGVDAPRCKVNPPWTKTVIVDPDTLEPLPPGERGLLRHFDLANRGHICAIQTDDVGMLVEGGFEVSGRAQAGEARGCSLTIDEMTRVMGPGLQGNRANGDHRG